MNRFELYDQVMVDRGFKICDDLVMYQVILVIFLSIVGNF